MGRDDEKVWEMMFLTVVILVAAYALYHFTEYEIEQQAKYEAQFCPPCKEKNSER